MKIGRLQHGLGCAIVAHKSFLRLTRIGIDCAVSLNAVQDRRILDNRALIAAASVEEHTVKVTKPGRIAGRLALVGVVDEQGRKLRIGLSIAATEIEAIHKEASSKEFVLIEVVAAPFMREHPRVADASTSASVEPGHNSPALRRNGLSNCSHRRR
ncbi:hypothetical protein H0176_19875 [Methylorubrum populi]|uniref:Uncharacterized protein n=1 Tax=Methylorubrum rhodesianum TaxID=29427 RepID=A0ABU9ZKB8_9HYPH|nr:hypothetical protein [Methylorubrum rhodesianum]MBK3401267.1 hypothetical protein [Methylorubrum rhodesianum]MBY0142519.1 hypothetical protein [Methylorubrum populi]